MENNNITRKKQDKRWVYITIGCVMICIAIFLIIWFLSSGNTMITNSSGEQNSITSLTCDGDGISYPFFSYDNSLKKSIKIIAKFSNKKIDTINLIYKLFYDSSSEIEKSSTLNHAAMNKSFSSFGLGADSLEAKYSSLDKYMQMTLYSDSKEVNGITGKYYLIDNAVSQYNRENLAKLYNEKGLDCVMDN